MDPVGKARNEPMEVIRPGADIMEGGGRGADADGGGGGLGGVEDA